MFVARFSVKLALATMAMAASLVAPAPAAAQTFTEVDSIDELRQAMAGSNGFYRLAPGDYTATEWEVFEGWPTDDISAILHLTGNNNVIDLTDVTIDVPVQLLRDQPNLRHQVTLNIWGDNNTVIGGHLLNTYFDGKTDHTTFNFRAYNEDVRNYGRRGGMGIRVMVPSYWTTRSRQEVLFPSAMERFMAREGPTPSVCQSMLGYWSRVMTR